MHELLDLQRLRALGVHESRLPAAVHKVGFVAVGRGEAVVARADERQGELVAMARARMRASEGGRELRTDTSLRAVRETAKASTKRILPRRTLTN